MDGGTAWDDPRIRQRLSQLYIDCEAMKYTRFRALTRQIRGEAPGPEGSILKLSGSELGVRIADAAGELLGMHALVNQGTELVPDAPRWFNRLVAARQYTISAGHQRDPAQHPRRARAGAAEGLAHHGRVNAST